MSENKQEQGQKPKYELRPNMALVRPQDNPFALQLDIGKQYNASSLLNSINEQRSLKTALIAGSRIITFGQLRTMISQAGNVLASRGASMERRVAILTDDGLDFIIVFMAAVKIGAVPVPLPSCLKQHELRYILDETRAAAAIVSSRNYMVVKEICGELPWKTEVIVFEPAPGAGTSSMREKCQEAPQTLNTAPTLADDTAFWVYTQGTSGFPKAVMHTHRAPLYSCKSYADGVIGLTEDDVILSTSPLHSSTGIVEKIFFPLYSGAAQIITDSNISGAKLIETVNTHKVTVLFSSPEVYRRVLETAEDLPSSITMPSLRFCVSTGSPLDLPLQVAWNKRFKLPLLNGMSSAESLYIYLTNYPGEIRGGSMGRPAPGFQVRVEDKNGAPVQAGQVGDIFVSGGSTMTGYWNNRRKNFRALFGSWLCTGDKCTFDDDGFCFFSGRHGEVMMINGQWVSPGDVEKNLTALPEVAQAAVVSALDKEDQAKIRAYVVLKPEYEPSSETASDIRIKANADQPLHMQVKWVEFVPDLPRSQTGRLQRYRLK